MTDALRPAEYSVMSPGSVHNLMNYVRVAVGAWRDDPRDDSELLARFTQTRDETAFAALVWRHGAMVWRTCKSILHNKQDTEDAFQNVFLALARYADQSAVKCPAGWLHKTARHAALNVRRTAIRRHEDARHSSFEATPAKKEDTGWSEQYAVLDEELSSLPEKLRVPLVLHYLEEKTQEEVARILGCSRTAVRKRLEKGEAILRDRMKQRGVAISAGAIAGLLGKRDSIPVVSARLIESTAQAAVAFRCGTLNGETSIAADKLLRSLMMKGAVQKLWWLALLCAGLTCIGGIGLVVWAIHGDGSNEANSTVSTTSTPILPVKSVEQPNKKADCFGDSLPDGAIARIGTVRFRPGFVGKSVSNVAFLPDGKTFVSVNGANKIFFWNILTGRELSCLRSSFDCKKVAISSDGKKIAACGSCELKGQLNGQVTVWSLTCDPPKLLWEQTLPNGTDSLAFSPTGEKLVVGVINNGYSFCFFDGAKGSKLQELKMRQDSTGQHVLAYSPDKNLLAIDGALYSATTEAKLCELKTSGGRNGISETGITCQNFSSDGKKLVTESKHGEQRLCRVWDTATGTELWKVESSKDTSDAFAVFTPDGQSVLEIKKFGTKKLSAWDVQICFWDSVTGKVKFPAKSLSNFPMQDISACDLCLSLDGKLLAGGPGSSVGIWEVATGQEVGTAGCPQKRIRELAFTRDGKKLATLSSWAGVDFWEADTGRQIQKLEQLYYNTSNLVNCDDHFMALCGIEGSSTLVITWDLRTGKALCIPRPLDVDPLKKAVPVSRDWIDQLSTGEPQTICTPPMRRQAFTTDCRWHLWAAPDSTITLIDRSTGKVARQLTGIRFNDDELIRFMAVSTDGQTIMCCHSIGTPLESQINVWSTATGKQLIDFKISLPSSVELSPDGRCLAVTSTDKKSLYLWEVASGTERVKLETDEAISTLTWSSDGRLLAVGKVNGILQLLDVISGREVCRFTGHRGKINALRFSVDGQRLASSSDDTTALIWDLRNLHTQKSKTLPLPSPDILWSALQGKVATEVWPAMQLLVQNPDVALPLLQERLRPRGIHDLKRVVELLAQLDSNDFQIRKQAKEQLEEMGEEIAPALQEALRKKPSLEAQKSIQDLLNRIIGPLPLSGLSPQQLQACRGVEVLERIGTPAAKRILEELSQQPTALVQTTEAKAALQRLTKPTQNLIP